MSSKEKAFQMLSGKQKIDELKKIQEQTAKGFKPVSIGNKIMKAADGEKTFSALDPILAEATTNDTIFPVVESATNYKITFSEFFKSVENFPPLTVADGNLTLNTKFNVVESSVNYNVTLEEIYTGILLAPEGQLDDAATDYGEKAIMLVADTPDSGVYKKSFSDLLRASPFSQSFVAYFDLTDADTLARVTDSDNPYELPAGYSHYEIRFYYTGVASSIPSALYLYIYMYQSGGLNNSKYSKAQVAAYFHYSSPTNSYYEYATTLYFDIGESTDNLLYTRYNFYGYKEPDPGSTAFSFGNTPRALIFNSVKFKINTLGVYDQYGLIAAVGDQADNGGDVKGEVDLSPIENDIGDYIKLTSYIIPSSSSSPVANSNSRVVYFKDYLAMPADDVSVYAFRRIFKSTSTAVPGTYFYERIAFAYSVRPLLATLFPAESLEGSSISMGNETSDRQFLVYAGNLS